MGETGIALGRLLDHPFEHAFDEGHARRFDRLEIDGRKKVGSCLVAGRVQQFVERNSPCGRRVIFGPIPQDRMPGAGGRWSGPEGPWPVRRSPGSGRRVVVADTSGGRAGSCPQSTKGASLRTSVEGSFAAAATAAATITATALAASTSASLLLRGGLPAVSSGSGARRLARIGVGTILRAIGRSRGIRCRTRLPATLSSTPSTSLLLRAIGVILGVLRRIADRRGL